MHSPLLTGHWDVYYVREEGLRVYIFVCVCVCAAGNILSRDYIITDWLINAKQCSRYVVGIQSVRLGVGHLGVSEYTMHCHFCVLSATLRQTLILPKWVNASRTCAPPRLPSSCPPRRTNDRGRCHHRCLHCDDH